MSTRNQTLGHIVQLDLKALVDSAVSVKDSTAHFAISCPECVEHIYIPNGMDDYESKKRLYVKKDYSVGFCHRCHSKFFAQHMDPNDDEWRFTLFYDSLEISEEELGIDISYYEGSSSKDPSGVEYLNSRYKQLGEIYHSLGIRFRRDKVIVPFIWNDEVIYYQSRRYPGRSTDSYFSPPTPSKPFYYCPLNDPKIDRYIISEGVFDAIAVKQMFPDWNSIAVIGSYLTNFQIKLLFELSPRRVLLYYDDVDISKKMRERLLRYNPVLLDDVKILTGKFKDPELDYVNGFTPFIPKEVDRSIPPIQFNFSI